MDRGVRIHGAASTGALLTVTLRDPRFIGMGRIAELVENHPEAADDLVAVLYTEHDGARLTEPLVNAALAFADIEEAGSTDSARLRELITALRTIPIENRTTATLASRLSDFLQGAGSFCRSPMIEDYKAEDARLLLRHLAPFGLVFR